MRALIGVNAEKREGAVASTTTTATTIYNHLKIIIIKL